MTTKKETHTPGPWKATAFPENTPHELGPLYIYAGRTFVASCRVNAPITEAEKRANARLIATAPDLLAALNNTADALEVFAGIAPILRKDAAWKAVVGRARAAIEKATL